MSSRRSRSGGDDEADDVETIQEVQPEPARPRPPAVSRDSWGGYDADIDAPRLIFTNPAQLAFPE